MVERYQPAVMPELRRNGLRPGVPAPAVVNPFMTRKEISFLSTGCTLLNCVVGGGWAFGRVVNIVGDKSTGKTLLAEEAMAIFCQMYPREKPHYRETEAAFDESYFAALGGDPSRIDFGPDGSETQWETVESIMNDIKALLDKFDKTLAEKVALLRKKRRKLTLAEAEAQVLPTIPPSLYIIDSLDALSSEAELARKVEDGSYGLEKQKLLGLFFRKEIRRMKRARMGLIVISQIRDRIGAMIRGVKYTRTGGKALDFYASIVLFLADLGKVYETNKGIKRPVAIKVKARATKNKITMPFRECIFELRFGYGVDDDWACLDWLKEVKRLDAIGLKEPPKNLKDVDLVQLKQETIKVWMDIEKSFTPAKGKYAA
jgi:RecA/RadA recombinase